MTTDRYQNHVRLRWHGFLAHVLLLTRTPKFLRFTYRMSTNNCLTWTWDALDQLDDQPANDEKIMVGVLAGSSTVHLDRVIKGRKVGEWVRTVDYDLHPNPPPDATLRDTAAWQAWCLKQLSDKVETTDG